MDSTETSTRSLAADTPPWLSGLIVPMLTPLTEHEDLDRPSLKRLIDFMLTGGADGLFVLGSNGEGATLRSQTRRSVVEATLDEAAGRVPVIAGVLETSTARVIEEIGALSDLDIAAFVVTTPFYFDGFDDEELFGHFVAIAEASSRPVVIYNIPQFAGTALSASLVRRLAVLPNIVGLKDSSGDWERFKSLIDDRPSEGFALLQGFHGHCAASLLAGADGLVPGYANLHPALFVEMIAAAFGGDSDRALQLQENLDRLLSFRGRASVHANKVVAQALGIMSDHVTSPLPRLDAESSARLLTDTAAAGLQGIA